MRKQQPTPVFFTKNPMDRGARQATLQRVTKSLHNTYKPDDWFNLVGLPRWHWW